MHISDVILQYLVSQNVHEVFLMTGGHVAFLIDRFKRHPKIKPICVSHEQAASMAAEAYSRIKAESIGVAIATSGPGATNLITGIGCGWFDSIPILLITGQVNTYESKGTLKVRQIGFQEMNIVDMVRPITKYAVQIKHPQDTLYHLQKAVHIAKSGRPGPVLLDIPMNIQRQDISKNNLRKFNPPKLSSLYQRNCRNHLAKCNELISQAKRPVFLIGGGLRNAKAVKQLKLISEKLQIPVCLSLNGIDAFPHDHDLYAGFIGVYGNRSGNFSLANADLLIAVGSRLDSRQTGVNHKIFSRASKKIIVDIDQNELNARIKADIPIHSDANTFIDSLLKANRNPPVSKEKKEWLSLIKRWRNQYLHPSPDVISQNIPPVNPYHFMEELNRCLQGDEIITLDTGQNMLYSMQTLYVRDTMRMFTAGGMSPMGYSFPAAIGASFAGNQKQRVICIIGDGGMQINIQELETLRRHCLPITVFVMNNHSLGLIRQFQDDYLSSNHVATNPSGGYTTPDFSKISQAYGIASKIINSHHQLRQSIQEALEYEGPFLCDVHVPENINVIPKSILGRPIEDQFPYLDDKEFFSNMLIKTERVDSN